MPSPGRPQHKPTPENRKTVESMAGFGVTQNDIADLLEIHKQTLAKHYERELRLGKTKANAKVAESLWKKATGTGPQSVTAGIWWSKTQMGWREPPQALEHTGKDGGPIGHEVGVNDAFRSLVEALDGAGRTKAGNPREPG